MKLALGTVQFGLDYGVANAEGQVAIEDAAEIIDHSRKCGIDTLDTAIGYGDSEERLGKIGIDGFRVITKLPGLSKHDVDIEKWIIGHIEGSLARLKVETINGVMLHRPTDLLGDNGKKLWDGLKKLKANGCVEKIGYSIYEPGELDLLWKDYQPDIIQAPYNILDQRLKVSGWLKLLHDLGVEVHVRSVFLQGLLLMPKERRPIKFQRWQGLWDVWEHWLESEQLDPVDVCLKSIASEPMIDYAVVGVDSKTHLKQIVKKMNNPAEIDVPVDLNTTDECLVNPALW